MTLLIKEDNINECITEDEIREEYISMIADFIKAKKDSEKNYGK